MSLHPVCIMQGHQTADYGCCLSSPPSHSITIYISWQQRLKTSFMPTRGLPGTNLIIQSDGSEIMEKWFCGKEPSGLH